MSEKNLIQINAVSITGYLAAIVGRLEVIERGVSQMAGSCAAKGFTSSVDRLVDNQDVCDMLHISKRTLQRYRSAGLPYFGNGHKTYYRESDLLSFLDRRTEPADKSGHKATEI